MAASRYLEAKLLAHSLKKTEFTMPSKIFIALCTAAPVKSNTGSTITEATYTGYARVEITAAQLAAVVEGDPSHIANGEALVLKVATAGESTVTDFAICDALTAGNMLYFGKLKESLTIKPAITKLEIPTSELVIEAE